MDEAVRALTLAFRPPPHGGMDAAQTATQLHLSNPSCPRMVPCLLVWYICVGDKSSQFFLSTLNPREECFACLKSGLNMLCWVRMFDIT